MTDPDEAQHKYYDEFHTLITSVPSADKLVVLSDSIFELVLTTLYGMGSSGIMALVAATAILCTSYKHVQNSICQSLTPCFVS